MRAKQLVETTTLPALANPAQVTTNPPLKGADDPQGLINVCKNNVVVAGILAKDNSREVDFEFNLHSSFPAIKFS